MNYNFDVGDNITITDDFLNWLEEIQDKNNDNIAKMNKIKEMIEFSRQYNTSKEWILETIEEIINGL